MNWDFHYAFLPFVSVFFLACTGHTGTDAVLSPYVNRILNDKSSTEYLVLSSCPSVGADGCICLVGEQDDCRILSQVMLECDSHDNVNGRFTSDGLPDFAGETVMEIIDHASIPYFQYLEKNGIPGLSERFAGHLFSALDTTCSLSCYDIDRLGRKPVAKVLVFTDPLFARYARADIDALLSSTSCGLKVLCPIELSFRELSSLKKESYNVGIICDSTYAGFSVFPDLLRLSVGEDVAASCFSAAPVDSDDILSGFLDSYRHSGGRDPLDAIILDNVSVDTALLRSELERIRDINRSDCLRYGKLLSNDFRIIVSSSCVADEVYRIFRESNLFTHNISYPVGVSFITVANPERHSGYCLIVPDDDV